MAQDDVAIAYLSLSTQRVELEIAARELDGRLRTVHDAETGVGAPQGRTSLRDLLESAIGETAATLALCDSDVQTLTLRMQTVETSAQELDLELGPDWETIPL